MNQLSSVKKEKISILIVNYKTRHLTGLCLNLIREKFDLQRLQVIVVDNDSRDESLDYLRSLDWVQLIERKAQIPEQGHIAHSSALDLGMQQVSNKYVLLMHSDALIKSAFVLDLLLQQLLDSRAVCAGTVDQRNRKLLSRMWRYTKRTVRAIRNRRSEQANCHSLNLRHNDDYIKSFCCLWDVSAIRNNGLQFCAENRNPGYAMQDRLLALGYLLKKVKARKLFQYVSHIQGGTHAEMGIHDELHRRSVMYRSLVMDNDKNGVAEK